MTVERWWGAREGVCVRACVCGGGACACVCVSVKNTEEGVKEERGSQKSNSRSKQPWQALLETRSTAGHAVQGAERGRA